MDENDIQQLRAQYAQIRDIPHDPLPNRKMNSGSAGLKLEELFGVVENNIPGPDYLGWEFKTSKKSDKSPLTLLTLKPSYPPLADNYMRKEFGYPDPPSKKHDNFPELKMLNTSIFGHRDSTVNKQWLMRLLVSREEEKVRIKILPCEGGKENNHVYWDFCCLRKRATEKLANKLRVHWVHEMQNGQDKFIYKDATAYVGFQWEVFLDGLENGKVQIDNRQDIHRSGDKKGTYHNHGTAFRVRDSEWLTSLYQKVVEI